MSAAGTGFPFHHDPILPRNSLQGLPAPPPNPRRLPPPCWSHEETVALIDTYRDKWYSLCRGSLKVNHWQEVADAVGHRCPAASPPKIAVQCRHKMEKLRKRYRTEIQRARSVPLSRYTSSWVHFKRMDLMEKGPQAKPDYNTESDAEGKDDEEEHKSFYVKNFSNVSPITPINTIHNLYGNCNPNQTGSLTGFRIRVPTATGVSIAHSGPNFYAKFEQSYVVKPNLSGDYGAKVDYKSGGVKESEEMGKKRQREAMEEMVGAIKLLGDGFVRVEEMKMEMAREIESMRMEMEMKRTGMVLELQQRVFEGFAKAFSDKKSKQKSKNMGSSDSS
ncbi:hypothetical protein K2173_011279 [Erythroxylum novogranatense]|uniref:Myb/SANT-like DNA-binding domain-containing protein n=1 Tax=Erythroxylum novogranatense TaxID=1862640 RepID=A0AAV8S9I9_9ROSI|nr:hypothetical protein K2173_011279 [Erythroxylum novogranatense]